MQTPYEALAEAREEIVALLEENRQLREEIQRLREKTANSAARG
jgi:regulator of replication initiation timing